MAATCPSRMCCCRCGAGFHDLQFHKGFGTTLFHYISYKSILSWSFESYETIYLKGGVDVSKVSCCIHSVACRTVADAVSRLQSSRFRGKVPPNHTAHVATKRSVGVLCQLLQALQRNKELIWQGPEGSSLSWSISNLEWQCQIDFTYSLKWWKRSVLKCHLTDSVNTLQTLFYSQPHPPGPMNWIKSKHHQNSGSCVRNPRKDWKVGIHVCFLTTMGDSSLVNPGL